MIEYGIAITIEAAMTFRVYSGPLAAVAEVQGATLLKILPGGAISLGTFDRTFRLFGPGGWDRVEAYPPKDVGGRKYYVTGLDKASSFETPKVDAQYLKEGAVLCFEQQSSITIAVAPGQWVMCNEVLNALAYDPGFDLKPFA